METVTHLLGQRHANHGVVQHGDGRGRQLDFPTANVHQFTSLQPGSGVYAAWASFAADDAPHAHESTGKRAALPAVVNIGQQPTIGSERPLRVEAHLLEWSGDCYGQTLRLNGSGSYAAKWPSPILLRCGNKYKTIADMLAAFLLETSHE